MIGITDCQNNDEMDFYRYTDSVFIFFAFLRRHDKNYVPVIFIITVCSSVAFANCDSRHPWLAANAVFY